jgi:cation diffusion facilitator CzcD-associated flavoprotein CzcO
MNTTHTDIIIIGWFIRIGAACHLSRKNPNINLCYFRSKNRTWRYLSLFKYPGIRSDSDMYTFGYSFKTWEDQKSFADGPSILKYINEALTNIRYAIISSTSSVLLITSIQRNYGR